ncbi:TetR family transcriptional regulator [Mesorhizobium loti]|nr:TetR/AcrR family transcriptional regulator [Mesorhizobium loti]PLP58926.1 TetR family transcriptional regulator [Mesorhizobium loti]
MKQAKPAATGLQLRRRPKQERSRERIDAILATAKRLIGEKGIDAVTMKEVGAQAGGPIATVYHYFPNKSAILATLYERFSEVTRARQLEITASIDGLESMVTASDKMLDDYYDRVAGDPAIQDLQNAIQADKALQNLDIAETHQQAKIFCDKVAYLLKPQRREEFRRMVFLFFQLAGGVVRLALTQDKAQGQQTVDDYKSVIHGQLRTFFD